MSFNFEEIPYEMKLSVFKKMDITTVARMRQSSKSVNAIIQKNRFKIKARSARTPIILKISVDGEKMSLMTKVAYKSVKKEDHAHLIYLLGVIPEDEFILIDNPFEQLSAVKFDYVFLDFNQLIGRTAYQMQRNMDAQATVFHKVFPLLESLRIDCDWLCLNLTAKTTEKTADILSRIKFTKFCFQGPCAFSNVQGWPIQNCDQLYLGNLLDVPERISPFIRNLTNGSFAFEAVEGIPEMIKCFILEIKEDPSVKGNLKKVVFFSIGRNYLDEIESLDVIWKGETICNGEMTVYKMIIDGEVIYVKVWQYSFEVEFLEEERDEEIIYEYTSCHCMYPCK